MVEAGHLRVDGAEVGPEGVRADDWLDVVVGVAGNERPDHGQPIGQRSQLGKCLAEGDAGNARGHFAGHAADFGRGGHLRIKRLDLARPAVQKQEDDRLVLNDLLRLRRLRPRRQQSRQRPAAEREAADLQKRPAIEALVSMIEAEHGRPPGGKGRHGGSGNYIPYHSLTSEAIKKRGGARR